MCVRYGSWRVTFLYGTKNRSVSLVWWEGTLKCIYEKVVGQLIEIDTSLERNNKLVECLGLTKPHKFS